MTGCVSTTPRGRISRLALREPVTPSERFRAAGASSASCCRCGCRAHWPACPSCLSLRPSSRPSTRAPARSSLAVRSSLIAWFRRRETCGRCAGNSGSARNGPARSFASGPASTLFTSRSPELRVKSLRSHLSTADLARLAQEGAVATGPPPLAILGGRPVIVRVEPQTLMFLDPETRELLRVRPTRLRASRRCGSKARAPPDRRRGPEPNQSPFSAASARPA